MNSAVYDLYQECLAATSDPSAAASLTLANLLKEDKGYDRPLTVPEVAQLLRVRQTKVLAWIRAGKLQAFNVTQKPGGRPKYRINPSALNAFMQLPAVNLPVQKGRPSGRHRRRIPEPEWAG